MRRVSLLISVWLLAMLCLALNGVRAQAPAVNTTISDIERPIQKDEQQVASWRREEHIEIACIIAVIAFVAIISTLQKSDSKWAKTFTLVLGAGAAILTGINARVFTADDRTLRRAAFEGDGVISQLWLMSAAMKDEHLSAQDRLNLKGEYLKKLLEFQAIGERLNGTTSTNARAENAERGSGVLPRVYAQSTVSIPDWVKKTPSDNISLYFVGKAYDTSFTNAKQNSLDDAFHKAVLALRPQAPNAPDAAILALVKASAVIQDSAFDYDQKTRNYAYYTLLRLSREIQSIGVRSLPLTTIAQSPQTRFQKKGWQPGDMTLNLSSGMFVLDTAGGVSKLVADQQGSSRIEKLFQLQPSYSGAALTASAESVFVVSNSSLGCTVHKYSLTTKVVSRRLMAVHEHCAGITTDGSTLYVTMPDRKEIRYWDSWDAPSYNSWSLAENGSPGYLMFDTKGHRLIIADDSGRAYAVSVPDGKNQLLASNLGFINSIATSQFHILVASGDKVLFLARSDNRGENPPSELQSLTGGRIVGLAIDAADKVWLADYDKKVVEGPFPLS